MIKHLLNKYEDLGLSPRTHIGLDITVGISDPAQEDHGGLSGQSI